MKLLTILLCLPWQASFLNVIRENLLKTTQSIRQLYGSTADAESKIREYVPLFLSTSELNNECIDSNGRNIIISSIIAHLYNNAKASTVLPVSCQLQVVLRLELCKPLYSDDQDHVEQMVEEV